MKLLRYLIFTTLAVMAAAQVVPGVRVDSWTTAVVVAVVAGVVNWTVKPVLILLTLPINILSLGLFTWVINAAMVLVVANLVSGFVVTGLVNALFFSIVTSLIGMFFKKIA